MAPCRPTLDLTVVTPTYNRAQLIRRALNSVRQQAHWPERLIVVDDGSTDGTPEVAARWAREHDFPLTVDVLPRNGGPAVARNRGIELATTRYVAFLDSDDEQLPGALQYLAAALDVVPNAVVSFVDGHICTPTGRQSQGLYAPRAELTPAVAMLPDQPPMAEGGLFLLQDATTALLPASIIPTSGTCFRRDAALAAGGMPADFRAGEDWLFWLRMSQQGRFVGQLRKLVLHHRHDDNLTNAQAAAFMIGEKMRGYAALASGTLGVRLNPAQRDWVLRARRDTLPNWRYHHSCLGLPAYLRALRGLGNVGGALPAWHTLADPRSLLRSLWCSLRPT